MAEERVRIEIGFDGGQTVRLHVPQEDADALARKLAAGGNGTADLRLEDGTCSVVVARVLYVTRYVRESRVGFGG